MKRFLSTACVAVAALLAGAPALAAVVYQYDVDAALNSSVGGAPLATLTVDAGEWLTITAGENDLWSAGPLPRWSNADGLVASLYATGSDESGQPAGTLIGRVFSLHGAGGFSAPHGALVGEIDGEYRLLGTSFSGPAWGAGTLNLRYWDSNAADNGGSVRVSMSVDRTTLVPAPLPLALIGAGALAAAFVTRVGGVRRRTATAD